MNSIMLKLTAFHYEKKFFEKEITFFEKENLTSEIYRLKYHYFRHLLLLLYFNSSNMPALTAFEIVRAILNLTTPSQHLLSTSS